MCDEDFMKIGIMMYALLVNQIANIPGKNGVPLIEYYPDFPLIYAAMMSYNGGSPCVHEVIKEMLSKPQKEQNTYAWLFEPGERIFEKYKARAAEIAENEKRLEAYDREIQRLKTEGIVDKLLVTARKRRALKDENFTLKKEFRKLKALDLDDRSRISLWHALSPRSSPRLAPRR